MENFDNFVVKVSTTLTLITLWACNIVWFNYSSAALALLMSTFLSIISYHMVRTEANNLEEKIIKINSSIILCFLTLFVGTCLINMTLSEVFGYCCILSVIGFFTIFMFCVGFPKKFKQLLPSSFFMLFVALALSPFYLFPCKVLVTIAAIFFVLGLLGCIFNK